MWLQLNNVAKGSSFQNVSNYVWCQNLNGADTRQNQDTKVSNQTEAPVSGANNRNNDYIDNDLI